MDDPDKVCDIRRAGVLPDGNIELDIRAQDGTFNWQWVETTGGPTREILAIALAAIVSGKSVECILDEADNTHLLNIYLVK